MNELPCTPEQMDLVERMHQRDLLIIKRRKEMKKYAHLIPNVDSPSWNKPVMHHDTDPNPSSNLRTAVKGKVKRSSSSHPPRGL